MLAEKNYINEVKIPKKLEKISENPMKLNFPNKDIYYYRNLIESQAFNEEFRQSVAESELGRDEWFNTKKKNDFGVFIDLATKPELDEVIKPTFTLSLLDDGSTKANTY